MAHLHVQKYIVHKSNERFKDGELLGNFLKEPTKHKLRWLKYCM